MSNYCFESDQPCSTQGLISEACKLIQVTNRRQTALVSKVVTQIFREPALLPSTNPFKQKKLSSTFSRVFVNQGSGGWKCIVTMKTSGIKDFFKLSKNVVACVPKMASTFSSLFFNTSMPNLRGGMKIFGKVFGQSVPNEVSKKTQQLREQSQHDLSSRLLTLASLPFLKPQDGAVNQRSVESAASKEVSLMFNGNSLEMKGLTMQSLPASLAFTMDLAKLHQVAVSSIRGLGHLDLSFFSHLQQLTSLSCTECPDLVRISWLTPPGADHCKLHILNFSKNPLLELLPLSEAAVHKSLKALDCRECSNLWSPPQEIARQGPQATMEFLWAISKGKGPGIFSRNMTLFLLGDGEAGKTSVFRALRDRDNKAALIQEDHRTVGIDLSKWNPADDVEFRVMDLAGQAVYETTHQFFLQRRAVYLLVWRAYPLQDGRLGLLTERIRHWLENLQLRMPGSYVMIVVTHIDSVSSVALDSQCSVVKEAVKHCLVAMGKWSSKKMALLEIYEDGECQRVNCLVGTGISALRERLLAFTRSMPWYGEALPKSWVQTSKEVERQIQNGRRHITLAEWTILAHRCGMEGTMLQMGTAFLHETGVIRFFGDISKVVPGTSSKESVFLDVSWMVGVLKGLVRHEHQVLQEYFLAHSDKEMLRQISRLNASARLHEALIPFLWPSSEKSSAYWKWVKAGDSREKELWPRQVIGSPLDLASAVELLEGFDMMTKDHKGNREYLVPAMLPIGKTQLPFQAYCDHEFPFTMEATYAKFPLGAFQRVVVRIGVWASEMEFGSKVAVCYWRGNIGRLSYSDSSSQTGCLKVDEGSEEHRKVSVLMCSSGKAMLEQMKAELESVESFFGCLSRDGNLNFKSSGSEAVQVTIVGLENEQLDLMERVLNTLSVFQGNNKLVIGKHSVSQGSIATEVVKRLRAVLFIITPALLLSTEAMQHIEMLRQSLKSSQIIPVLMHGVDKGIGCLEVLRAQACDMQSCTRSKDIFSSTTLWWMEEQAAVLCAERLLKKPVLDILDAWRIDLGLNISSLANSLRCSGSCPHQFDRSELLRRLEDARSSQHEDKAIKTKIDCPKCSQLHSLHDLLVIPEVRPCPACVKHGEKNLVNGTETSPVTLDETSLGTFNARMCRLSFGENLKMRNSALLCQVCVRAGRPGRIHLLDVCPPDIFVSLHPSDLGLLESLLRGIETEADVLIWAGAEGNQEDLAALERASVVVAILSDKYFQSLRCTHELTAALSTGKLVIPLLLTLDGRWSGSSRQDYWKHVATLHGGSVSDWSLMDQLKPLVLSTLANPQLVTDQMVGLIMPRIHRAVNLRVFSEMPMLGVRLSYLKTFVEHCGGREMLIGKSTDDVMQGFVKPGTKATHVSWCEKLMSESCSKGCVGMATWFVSHAWKYPFLDVVDTLESHFEGKEDPAIWFDVFSVSQHQTVDRTFDWWNTTFLSAVGQIGQMVMVVLDWECPATLARVWCIFEVFAAYCTRSHFCIAMPRTVAQQFVVTMLTPGGMAALLRLLEGVQCESAEATQASDRDLILDTVRRTVGLDKLDSLVISVICQALRDTLQGSAAVVDSSQCQQRMLLTHALAHFRWLFRDSEGALQEFERLLKMDWGAMKCRHDLLLDALVTSADILCQLGRQSEACKLLVASEAGVLESSAGKLGSGQQQVQAYVAMGWVAAQHGSLKKAFKQLKAWQVCLADGGCDNAAVDNLAVDALSILKSTEEMEVLHSVLNLRAASLGIYHPDTLDAMFFSASKVQSADNQKMLQACLGRQERMLGLEHPRCQATRDAISKSSDISSLKSANIFVIKGEVTTKSREMTTLESVWMLESRHQPLVLPTLFDNLGCVLKDMSVKRHLILELCHVEEWMDSSSMARLLKQFSKDIHSQGLSLDLRFNALGPHGAMVLAPVLASLANLQTLHIWGNTLGPEGAAVLSPSLAKLSKLKTLRIGNEVGDLGDQGAAHVAAALPSMPALTYLSIFNNDSSIGAATMAAVKAAALPSLENIY